ncbi:MAG: PilN domain-containing protein [Planctomycetota bacterium]|jgi:Tfp pilus assembly protein PilN
MIGVNLVPPRVLAARKRSRRVKSWAVVIAVVAGLSAIPVILEFRQQARLTSLLERRSQTQSQRASVRAELTELNRSLAELNQRIERADMLRTKRPWAALLSLIVQQMPEQVWLTSLTTGSPQAPAKGAASSSPNGSTSAGDSEPAEVVVMDGASQINLTGFAVDHEHLYDFMTLLKGSQAFASVELVKAGKEPVLQSRAVRFELTCSW